MSDSDNVYIRSKCLEHLGYLKTDWGWSSWYIYSATADGEKVTISAAKIRVPRKKRRW